MELRDASAACLVLTRAFLGSPEEIGFLDATRYVERMLASVPQGIMYVARLVPTDPALLPPQQESRLVGLVALSFHPAAMQQVPTLPPPPHCAYLSNMSVETQFRRNGIARALLAVSDSAARVAGHSEMYLHVRQGDDPAQRLYAGAGYQEVARDSFLSAKLRGVRPRVLMRKTLA